MDQGSMFCTFPAFIPSGLVHAEMNLTHAHFNISFREIDAPWYLASAHHFGHSRLSGLAPGCVYFDDITIFRYSIVFSIHTRKQRFQK